MSLEIFFANLTSKSFDIIMETIQMFPQRITSNKTLAADVTDEISHILVFILMQFKIRRACKVRRTNIAFVRTFAGVRALVLHQLTATCERFIAVLALIWFYARVRPQVQSQPLLNRECFMTIIAYEHRRTFQVLVVFGGHVIFQRAALPETHVTLLAHVRTFVRVDALVLA